MKILNKKGLLSLGQLLGIIMLLVVLGIMLTVGLRVDSGFQELVDDRTTTQTLTNETTSTVVNETTGTTFAAYSTTMRNCALTVTYATNATNNSVSDTIGSGNYTVTGCSIAFTSTESGDEPLYNNTLWNITGTVSYSEDSQEYNATVNSIEGKANIAENQGLLGTIIIFGVIISVVVVSFMVRGGSGF